MLNLDTHILIFAITGELRPSERDLLAENSWSISGIVLWEIARLAQLGRIDFDIDDSEITRTLAPVQIWPIDLAVARASTRLDFSSDPADALIAATSIVHDIPLLTRDDSILKSRIVPLAG